MKIDFKKFLSTKKGKIIFISACCVILIALVLTFLLIHNSKRNEQSVLLNVSSSENSISDLLTDSLISSSSSETTSSTSSNSSSVTTSSSTSSSSSTPTSSATTTTSSATSTSSTTSSTVTPTVTSVDFTFRSKSCKVGDSFTLVAKITPTSLSNTNLTWATTNSSVATVTSNGVVTAKGTGTAYIRATASNGQRDTCTVSVTSTASTSTTTSSTSSSTASTSASSTQTTSSTVQKNHILTNWDTEKAYFENNYNMYEDKSTKTEIFFNDDGVKNREGATLYLAEYNGTYSVAGWQGGNGFGEASNNVLIGIFKYYFPNSWSELNSVSEDYDTKGKTLTKYYDGWTVEITWDSIKWY